MKKAKFKLMIDNEIKYACEHGWNSFELRPIVKVGSFRHSQYSADHSDQYIKYLDSLGLDHVEGNDAPKGGKLGNFILVSLNDEYKKKYPEKPKPEPRKAKILNINDKSFNFDAFDKNINFVQCHSKMQNELRFYIRDTRGLSYLHLKDDRVLSVLSGAVPISSAGSIEGFYFPNFDDPLKCIAFINGRAHCVIDK